MGKKVRSMRGELIDWDLATVKNQMKDKPAPVNVKNRQDFIDAKLRRRVKKVKDQLGQLESSKVDRKIAAPPVEERAKIDEAPVEANTTEQVETPEVENTTSKRSVRRKSSTSKASTDDKE
jgi:hypothetical protein